METETQDIIIEVPEADVGVTFPMCLTERFSEVVPDEFTIEKLQRLKTDLERVIQEDDPESDLYQCAQCWLVAIDEFLEGHWDDQIKKGFTHQISFTSNMSILKGMQESLEKVHEAERTTDWFESEIDPDEKEKINAYLAKTYDHKVPPIINRIRILRGIVGDWNMSARGERFTPRKVTQLFELRSLKYMLLEQANIIQPKYY